MDCSIVGMKAVLLARGLGSRMKTGRYRCADEGQAKAAAAGAKGMMPIGLAMPGPFLTTC